MADPESTCQAVNSVPRAAIGADDRDLDLEVVAARIATELAGLGRLAHAVADGGAVRGDRIRLAADQARGLLAAPAVQRLQPGQPPPEPRRPGRRRAELMAVRSPTSTSTCRSR